MQLQQEQYRIFLNQQRNSVCSECQSNKRPDEATTHQDSTPTAEVKPWTLVDWQTQLRWNILRMTFPAELSASTAPTAAEVLAFVNEQMTKNKETSEATTAVSDGASTVEADLSAACDLLLMYFNNLLKNPTVPRYRRMSTINGSYVKSLSTVQHHTAVLTAVGFQQKADSTYYEYEWHTLPTAVDEITGGNVKDGKGPPGNPQSDNSRSAPATVGEARILLEEAVQLLGALKTSRAALLQAVLAKLTGETPTTEDGASVLGTCSVSTIPSKSPSAVPSSVSSTTVSENGTLTCTMAAPDKQLISVADVTEGDGRLLGSGAVSDSASDNLDFMKVLAHVRTLRG